jgi:hypothetical protein
MPSSCENPDASFFSPPSKGGRRKIGELYQTSRHFEMPSAERPGISFVESLESAQV